MKRDIKQNRIAGSVDSFQSGAEVPNKAPA